MARPALSASRTMDILDLFAAFPARAFTMSEIMRAAGINVASCHAVLNAMVARGYLQRRGKTYVLGSAPLAIGQASLLTHPIVAVAQDAARALNEELGVAVLLSTLAGDEILALTSLPNAEGRVAGIRAGQRAPLVPPSGAHFLAWESDQAIDEWIARAHSDDEAEIAGWRHSLALTRARGFQVTLRASRTPGFAALMAAMAEGTPPLEYRAQASTLIADHGWMLAQPEAIEPAQSYDVALIAAPVFDRAGHAMLSLGFGGFRDLLTGAAISELAERLLTTCLDIARTARDD